LTADQFVSGLAKVRRTAPGEWVACCPAHEDRSPSLAVKEADDGRILVHCFAGCSFESVVSAAGAKPEELFPAKPMQKDHAPRFPFNPATVLRALAFNATIVAIAASDMAQGKQLTVEEKDKLFDIAGEFNEAVSYATR
jgi:hypothetical protein